MALNDRMRRPAETAISEPTGPFDSREDILIVAAGSVITVGVLYDVYRRQTRSTTP
ncbi:hypothetical protein [Halorussus pelagicus]|uniref:hypothetical protein n=1 Tax=Halorussus pelagicus TaxID=2505977 RepID=UPI001407E59A|nr:hypothetical protein [Halorussus pelagicus]